jgi:hypothetical protein
MSFAENDEGGSLFVDEQIFERQADVGDHLGARKRWLMTERREQVAISTSQIVKRIGHVDHKVRISVKSRSKTEHVHRREGE